MSQQTARLCLTAISRAGTEKPPETGCESNASDDIGIVTQGGGERQGGPRHEMQSCLSSVSGRYGHSHGYSHPRLHRMCDGSDSVDGMGMSPETKTDDGMHTSIVSHHIHSD